MSQIKPGASWSVGLWLLFVAIQLASLVITLAGIFVLAVLAAFKIWHVDTAGKYHWPALFWIWDNQEDGICAAWYRTPIDRWHAYTWSAFRNSANNLRYVRGVSDVTRPLWRQTWGAKPGGWYAQAGWNNSGYPVISGGRNVNPY